MAQKLTDAIHAIPLRHARYCGRIAWDARNNPIQFTVEIARKRKHVPRRMKIPIIYDDGEIAGSLDLGNASQMMIATLAFEQNHDFFEENFYSPQFPKIVQVLVADMLKNDGVLKKRLEEALSC